MESIIPTWVWMLVTAIGSVMCAIQGFSLWQISDLKAEIKDMRAEMAAAKNGKQCEIHTIRIETIEKRIDAQRDDLTDVMERLTTLENACGK